MSGHPTRWDRQCCEGLCPRNVAQAWFPSRAGPISAPHQRKSQASYERRRVGVFLLAYSFIFMTFSEYKGFGFFPH